MISPSFDGAAGTASYSNASGRGHRITDAACQERFSCGSGEPLRPTCRHLHADVLRMRADMRFCRGTEGIVAEVLRSAEAAYIYRLVTRYADAYGRNPLCRYAVAGVDARDFLLAEMAATPIPVDRLYRAKAQLDAAFAAMVKTAPATLSELALQLHPLLHVWGGRQADGVALDRLLGDCPAPLRATLAFLYQAFHPQDQLSAALASMDRSAEADLFRLSCPNPARRLPDLRRYAVSPNGSGIRVLHKRDALDPMGVAVVRRLPWRAVAPPQTRPLGARPGEHRHRPPPKRDAEFAWLAARPQEDEGEEQYVPSVDVDPVDQFGVPLDGDLHANELGLNAWGIVRNAQWPECDGQPPADFGPSPTRPQSGHADDKVGAPFGPAPPTRSVPSFQRGPYAFFTDSRMVFKDGEACNTLRHGKPAPIGRSAYQAAIFLFRHQGQFVSRAILAERLQISEAAVKSTVAEVRRALAMGNAETLETSRYVLLHDPFPLPGQAAGFGIFDTQVEFGYLSADPALDPAHVFRPLPDLEPDQQWVLNDALTTVIRPGRAPLRLEPKPYSVLKFLLQALGRFVPHERMMEALDIAQTRTLTGLLTQVSNRALDSEGTSADLINPHHVFVMKHDSKRGAGIFWQPHELGLTQAGTEHYPEDIVRGPGYLLNARGGTRTLGCIIGINGEFVITGPLGLHAMTQLLQSIGHSLSLSELLVDAPGHSAGSVDLALRKIRRAVFASQGEQVRYRMVQRGEDYAIHPVTDTGESSAMARLLAAYPALPERIVLRGMQFDVPSRTLTRDGKTIQLGGQEACLLALFAHQVGTRVDADRVRGFLGIDPDAPAHELLDVAFRLRQAMGLPPGNRWSGFAVPNYLLTLYASVGGGLFDVHEELGYVTPKVGQPDPPHIMRLTPHSSFGSVEYVFNARLYAVMQRGESPRWFEPGHFKGLRAVLQKIDRLIPHAHLIRALGVSSMPVLHARMGELRTLWPLYRGPFDLRFKRGEGYFVVRTSQALYPTARSFRLTLPSGIDLESVLAALPPIEQMSLRRFWELPLPPEFTEPEEAADSQPWSYKPIAPIMSRLQRALDTIQAARAANEPTPALHEILEWLNAPQAADYLGSESLLKLMCVWYGVGARRGPASQANLAEYGIASKDYWGCHRELVLRLARGARQTQGSPITIGPSAALETRASVTAVPVAVPTPLELRVVRDPAAVRQLLRRVPVVPALEARTPAYEAAIAHLVQEYALPWPANVSLPAALAELASDLECVMRAYLGVWPYAERYELERLVAEFDIDSVADAERLIGWGVRELSGRAELLAGASVHRARRPMTMESLAELIARRGPELAPDDLTTVLRARGLGRTANTRLEISAATREGRGVTRRPPSIDYFAALARLTGFEELAARRIAHAKRNRVWDAARMEATYRRVDAGMYARLLLLLCFDPSLQTAMDADRYVELVQLLGIEELAQSSAQRDIADETFAGLVLRGRAAADKRARFRTEVAGGDKAERTGHVSSAFIARVEQLRQFDPQLEEFAMRADVQDALRERARKLTPAQFPELLLLLRDGREALGEFIVGNMRYAIEAARLYGYNSADADTEYILHRAIDGLALTAGKHDTRMTQFVSLATWVIRFHILNGLAEKAAAELGVSRGRAAAMLHTVATRRRLSGAMSHMTPAQTPSNEQVAHAVFIERFTHQLTAEKGEPPTADELLAAWASALPRYLKKIEQHLALADVYEKRKNQVSLDAPAGDTSRTGHDVAPKPVVTDHDDLMQPGGRQYNLVAVHLIAALEDARLDEVERDAILYSFGIGDYEELAPAEIAGALDLPVDEFDPLLTAAIAKLQASPAAMAALTRYRQVESDGK